MNFRPLESAEAAPDPATIRGASPLVPGSIPATPRQSARRLAMVARMVFGVALLGLSAFNATWSPALGRAREAEGSGNYSAALTEALSHLERRPSGREAHRIAARCLSRLDFAELAEPHYLAGRPDLLDRHYRAYGLVRANLRDRAIAAYDEILAIRPDDVAALRAEAGVLLASSRWDDVARIGRKLAEMPAGPVLAESPLNVSGHWTLRPVRIESVQSVGSTLEALARHDDSEPEMAVAAFERVLAVDPDLRSMPLPPVTFWASYAADLASIGRFGDAIARLKTLTEASDDPDLLLQLGTAYELSGSIAEAEGCWRQILDRRPDQPGAWLNLGRIALQRGDPAEAVRRLTRAQELLPRSYDASYNLGLAYRRLGQIEPAKQAEARSLELRNRSKDQPQGTAGPPARLR